MQFIKHLRTWQTAAFIIVALVGCALITVTIRSYWVYDFVIRSSVSMPGKDLTKATLSEWQVDVSRGRVMVRHAVYPAFGMSGARGPVVTGIVRGSIRGLGEFRPVPPGPIVYYDGTSGHEFGCALWLLNAITFGMAALLFSRIRRKPRLRGFPLG